MSELYVGLMSGTSMDAIDAVVIEFTKAKPRLVHTESTAWTAETRARLLEIITYPESVNLDQIAELDELLGEQFALAVDSLLAASDIQATDISAIGSHGQTIRHCPDAAPPFTWQIGDPNVIAARTGITTVADFRRRDIALGGQGAPLAPAFHKLAFSDAKEIRAVINIGGIANISCLHPNKPVTGFDTGPGNVLMDLWCDLNQGEPYDKNGAWAASAEPNAALLKACLADSYFRQTPPKSTGREYFRLKWLEQNLSGINPQPDPASIQATLCEVTAQSINAAVDEYLPDCSRIILCGGGAHNSHLRTRISDLNADRVVDDTGSYDIEPDWVEAAAFAWMARCAIQNEAIDLVAVTGASEPAVLGTVCHGSTGAA